MRLFMLLWFSVCKCMAELCMQVYVESEQHVGRLTAIRIKFTELMNGFRPALTLLGTKRFDDDGDVFVWCLPVFNHCCLECLLFKRCTTASDDVPRIIDYFEVFKTIARS